MENKEKKLNYSIQDFLKNKHSKSAWGGGLFLIVLALA